MAGLLQRTVRPAMLMDDCIFCKIARKEIPAKVVYEDEKIIAFHDLNPVSPVHVLIITKEHIGSMDEVNESNIESVSHLMLKAPEIARGLGLVNGYRLVANTGVDGGQTVGHLHFHLGGGRHFAWPPG